MRFSLIPFSAPEEGPQYHEVSIKGEVNRQKHLFSIHYVLAGNLEAVLIPPLAESPTRKADLWQSTCFEFFLAIKSSPEYWEFNLSPSGDWNAYVMDAYRQVNMREEACIQEILFQVDANAESCTLQTEFDMRPIIQAGAPIRVGISSVIALKSGTVSYWALIHPHANPDFHLRDSFRIEFP